MRLQKIGILAVWASLALMVGCGSQSDNNDLLTHESQTGVMGEGSISGTVVLKGPIPTPVYFSMDADPTCRAQHEGPIRSETVMVDAKGDLQNVLVYVKDGAANYPAPKTQLVLEQKGCMYYPHVFGLQVGQPLEIINEDPTLHNVHCMAVTNDSFNVGQPVQGMKTQKVFTKPEMPIEFKCDVHGWMHCYCGVFTNPFYAVTASNGSFEIKGLPVGTYTLVAWQEKYGASAPQTIHITPGNEVQSAHFTFTSTP